MTQKSMRLRYEPFLEAHFCEVAVLKLRTSRYRCRANMPHIRLSRPNSGLGFQSNVVAAFYVVLSSPIVFSSHGSGPLRGLHRHFLNVPEEDNL